MTAGGTTHTKERIIVVDDDPAGRYIKCHALRREGYEVMEAASGREALALLEQDPPALMVADMKLPDMTGLELGRETRKRCPACMILQTSAALTGSQYRTAGLVSGADAYLVEPLVPAEFIATVEALLRRHRAGRNLTDEIARSEERLATVNARLRSEMDQRAEAEDLLRHAQKLDVLGQLTGGIAHDFNNLLTIVTGNLESLRRQMAQSVPDLPRIRDHAERAFFGAQRAIGVTRQLLAFSRRQALDPKIMDLNDALSHLSQLLRQVVGEGIVLDIRATEGLWPVRVDPTQLETAVLNVALNARDAMPEGGRITIEAANAGAEQGAGPGAEQQPAGDFVVLNIADSGMGMSEAVRKLAFEPFFTTKDVGHGTGLGLSQVYGFVTQSGGRVEMDSAVGAGTVVRIFLPRYDGPLLPETAGSVEQPAGISHGLGLRVLVVEDDAEVGAHATGVLEELGYATAFAQSGAEALAALESGPPVDLLFTDVGLPGGVSGPELARRARAQRPDLAVLYVSGYSNNRLRREGVAMADPFISKPYTFDALSRALALALSKRPQYGAVLVVEDEPMIRMDLVYSLGQLGFRVREAGSAAEALEVLAKEGAEIAALVTDIGLPDGRGDDLANRARADRAGLPVIVTSGYGSSPALQRDARTAFLAKPYHPEQIAAALRSMGVGQGAALN